MILAAIILAAIVLAAIQLITMKRLRSPANRESEGRGNAARAANLELSDGAHG